MEACGEGVVRWWSGWSNVVLLYVVFVKDVVMCVCVGVCLCVCERKQERKALYNEK